MSNTCITYTKQEPLYLHLKNRSIEDVKSKNINNDKDITSSKIVGLTKEIKDFINSKILDKPTEPLINKEAVLLLNQVEQPIESNEVIVKTDNLNNIQNKQVNLNNEISISSTIKNNLLNRPDECEILIVNCPILEKTFVMKSGYRNGIFEFDNYSYPSKNNKSYIIDVKYLDRYLDKGEILEIINKNQFEFDAYTYKEEIDVNSNKFNSLYKDFDWYLDKSKMLKIIYENLYV